MTNDLLEKARDRLPLPMLMDVLGYGESAKSSAKSPFREEKSPSFGIYNRDGRWRWKDHGTNEGGDEVDFLGRVKDMDNKAAIAEFIRLAGCEQPKSANGQAPHGKYKLGANPWEKYKSAAGNDFISAISIEREMTAWIVGAMVGNDVLGADGNQPAFKNGDGAHVRQSDGSWRFVPSGIRVEALTFGNHLSREVYVFESQWDAMAVADKLGQEAFEKLFVVTRGASNGKMAGDFAQGRKVFAFPQNDLPKPGGKIPSEQWMKDVSEACSGAVLRVETPKKYKDANDWTAAGATKLDIIKAIRSAVDPSLIGVEVHTFNQLFEYQVKNDDTSLLGDRWVCHGGQLLLVGQSGIGKSSLTVQAALMWAMGLPFMGIVPARPLRSLFIQAENDEGDMAEIVQGVCSYALQKAVNSRSLTSESAKKLMTDNVTFVRVTAHTGDEFIRVVRRLLDDHGPKDLVFGDPLLSYIGDDISQQKVTSHFLRTLCNPVAFERKFAWVWSHHTGKPSSDSKARKHWNENDYAYIGLGSSELTNWARAIAVLQSTKHEGIFKLLLAKRGRRANIVDVNSQPTNVIAMKHADTGIYWEACDMPDEEEEDGKRGRPAAMSKIQEAELIAFAESWPDGKRGLYAEAAKKFGHNRESVRRFLTAAKTE